MRKRNFFNFKIAELSRRGKKKYLKFWKNYGSKSAKKKTLWKVLAQKIIDSKLWYFVATFLVTSPNLKVLDVKDFEFYISPLRSYLSAKNVKKCHLRI